MKNIYVISISVFLLLCLGTAVIASDDSAFEPPKILKWAKVPIPRDVVAKLGKKETVTLELVVDKNGKPHRVKVQSSTNKSLNKTAIKVVEKSTFQPASIDGVPVDVRIRLPYEYEEKPKNSD